MTKEDFATLTRKVDHGKKLQEKINALERCIKFFKEADHYNVIFGTNSNIFMECNGSVLNKAKMKAAIIQQMGLELEQLENEFKAL